MMRRQSSHRPSGSSVLGLRCPPIVLSLTIYPSAGALISYGGGNTSGRSW